VALTLINPFASSACVLFGMYGFFFTGFDSSGPVTTGGVFGVDANGSVSGEEDFKDLAETRAAQPIREAVHKQFHHQRGTLTVTTATGTSTYSFATQGLPVPGVRGQMAESGDANGVSGSGRFVFSPPGNFFSGDYVIALTGNDSSGGRMGVLGRFTDNDNNCEGCTGTLSAGEGDINDNGAITPSVQITGNVSVPDLYSRSIATLTLGTQTLQIAFYVFSSGGGFAVDMDSGASSRLLAGFVSS
jgi:hypothetical protein